MRARMALLSSGVVCELREVALRSKPAEMLAISPKGTVPVLQLPDGHVLEQSLDIMLWALQRHDPGHWLADTETQHAHHLALIAECDGPFKAHLDRYKYPNRYDLTDGLAHQAQGCVFLDLLDKTLTRTLFLAGSAWGLPDAAIAPFVRQWAHTDPVWFTRQPWPALQQWLQTFEVSPAFECAMTKYAPWQPGNPTILFPKL
jgi:glutathione S-transferase